MQKTDRDFDIYTVAAAIDADAGQSLPDLRQALYEVKAGANSDCRVTTAPQWLAQATRDTLGRICGAHSYASGNTSRLRARPFYSTRRGVIFTALLHAHPDLSKELITV